MRYPRYTRRGKANEKKPLLMEALPGKNANPTVLCVWEMVLGGNAWEQPGLLQPGLL